MIFFFSLDDTVALEITFDGLVLVVFDTDTFLFVSPGKVQKKDLLG